MFKKKQPQPQTPAQIQESRELELVRKLAPKKIPKLKQYRYLPRVLEQRERRYLALSFLVFILATGILGYRFFLRSTVAVAAEGGTYTEGLVGAPRFINPLLGSANDVDRDISSLVFSGLMKKAADGSIVPDMASQYRVNDDQTQYTIELRDDITWHDGEPVTADDVIFSIQTIQDPAFKSPLRVTFSGVSITRIDSRTVQFTLPEAFPSFLSALTVGILPQHLWYSIPASQAHLAEINIKPIGSGPFRFDSLTKDSNGTIRNLTLTKNREYYDRPPYIDAIVFKFYPDVETAIEALTNKNVDGLGFLPLEHKDQLEHNDGINLYELELPQHRALFFNPNTNSLLGERTIRRALAYATDRERIVSEVLGGNGSSITSPVVPGFSADSETIYNYDPAEAATLLENNGWSLNEETGIREKNETELRFTITTVDQIENVQAARIIQENWQAIGIRTEVAVVERERIKNDIIEPRSYEALLFGQITTSQQDVYAFWHSSQTNHPGNNLSIFANKDIDAALEELRNTTDTEKQQELYKSFVNKLGEEAFAVFLYTPTYIYPVSTAVKGVDNLTNVSFPSERFAGIEDWYIKTRRESK